MTMTKNRSAGLVVPAADAATSGHCRTSRRRRRVCNSNSLLTATSGASTPSPLGPVSLALLLLLSDITGKLPPSVVAERRRYYSSGSRRGQQRREDDDQRRQRRTSDRRNDDGNYDQRPYYARGDDGDGGRLGRLGRLLDEEDGANSKEPSSQGTSFEPTLTAYPTTTPYPTLLATNEEAPPPLVPADFNMEAANEDGLFLLGEDESTAGAEAETNGMAVMTTASAINQVEFKPLGTCGGAENDRCNACEGTCKRDRDCAPGLKCFKRKESEDVPGCVGTAVEEENYCYDPNAVATTSNAARTTSEVAAIEEKITYSEFLAYQELGTVECTDVDGSTQIRGYDNLSALRIQLEAGQFVRPRTIPDDQGLVYTICPGTTFNFVEVVAEGEAAVVLPPLKIMSSMTTLRCGEMDHTNTAVPDPNELLDASGVDDMPNSVGREKGDDGTQRRRRNQLEEEIRCTLTGGLSHLLVEAGLQNVNVHGLYFSDTQQLGNSVIVQKYPRMELVEDVDGSGNDVLIVGKAMPVNFVGCTWSGNRGSSALGVERLQGSGEPTFEPTAETDEPTQVPTRPPRDIPTAAPSDEPTLSPRPTVDDWCFTDWELLTEAVASGPRGSTYYVCPNTVMDLRTDFNTGSHPPFYIEKSNTVIKCGLSGERSNTCYIYGNTEHFIFVGHPRNVRIEGITMFESNGVASIIAAGDERASATFVDCAWYRNEGRAVVLIAKELYEDGSTSGAGRFQGGRHVYGGAFLAARKNGRRLIETHTVNSRADFQGIPPPPEGGSMTVKFEDCLFRNNAVEYSVVTNWGGRTMLDGCYFRKNDAITTMVGVFYDGEVSLSTTCFVDNSATYPGTVFLQDDSALLANNFNHANRNDVGDCQDIWHEESCPSNGEQCDGVCESYTEDECPFKPTVVVGMNQVFAAASIDFDIDEEATGDETDVQAAVGEAEVQAAGDELSVDREEPVIVATNVPEVVDNDALNNTSSASPSMSLAPTLSGAPTGSATNTSSMSPSISPVPTASGAPMDNATNTSSMSPSISPVPTASGAPTDNATNTSSMSPSMSPAPTATGAPTGNVTNTTSMSPSMSPAPTATGAPATSNATNITSMSPSISPVPTAIGAPTIAFTPTFAPSPNITSGEDGSQRTRQLHFHTAEAASSVSASSTLSTNLEAQRTLQQVNEESFGDVADISLSRCSFERNSVTGSVVGGNGGRLDIINSIFSENEAVDSVVEATRGMVTISRSCFQGNAHDASRGVVFVSSEAFIGRNEDNYGNNNTGDIIQGEDLATVEVCNGIFVEEGIACGILPPETCDDQCIVFDAVTCEATGGDPEPRGICLSDPTTEGYSDLAALQRALDDSIAEGTEESTFILCPFTTYSFADDDASVSIDPIRISRSNVRIQCGSEGSSANGCIFYGGSRHLIIENGSLDVKIQGIRFVASTEVSVVIDGSDSATTASFSDSHWQENKGTENVLILGPGMGNGPLPEDTDVSAASKELDTAPLEPTGSPTVNDDDSLFPPDDGDISDGPVDDTLTASPAANGDGNDDGNDGNMDDDLPTDDFFNFDRGLQDDEEICGSNVCGVEDYCCNESCNLCAPIGDLCIQLDCESAGVFVQMEGVSFLDNSASKSVIVNDGGELEVHEADFQRNEALDSVISTSDGIISITDSSFKDNTHESETGVVFVDVESTLMRNDNNYGLDNEDVGGGDTIEDACGGIFVATVGCAEDSISCDGICDTFKAETSPTTPYCISIWNDLMNTIDTANKMDKGGTFIICPLTDFVLTTNDASAEETPPVLITASGIKLKCGEDGSRENECVFSGGYDHFVIGGSNTIVEFVGLTMKSSSGIASVVAAADSQSEAVFTDCLWMDNEGSAVVTIYNEAGRHGYDVDDNPQDPDSDRTIYDIPPPGQGSMKVSFEYCEFTDNVVDQAVILNARGELSVTDCYFNLNEAEASAIGVFHNGELTLERSCFEDNVGDITGSVFVETASRLTLSATENFGQDNLVSSAGICEDISRGACDAETSTCDGDFCLEFDADICMAEELVPDDEPRDQPTTQSDNPDPPPSTEDCLSSWSDLQNAISAAGVIDKPTFTLCPDTVFEVDPFSPVTVDTSRTTIKCGSSGSRTNKCTIAGGTEHFIIKGAATDVVFAGLTMVAAKGDTAAATSASVIAESSASSQATFVDCEWAGNTGSAVVMIAAPVGAENQMLASAEASEETRDVERRRRRLTVGGDLGLPPSQGKAMTAFFRYCLFSDNDVEYGVVANLGGKAVFFDTQFLGNKAQGTAIGAFYDAFVSLQNSCFVGNERDVPGTVFIEEGSNIASNSDNFAVGDIGGESSSCSSIFLEGVCVTPDPCDGFCDEFTATSCRAAEAPLEPLVPMPSPSPCYSDWKELSTAVTSDASENQEYIICPETTLNAETPIVVKAGSNKNAVIKCGEDGDASNSCVINGGSSHFKITGSAHLAGLTMQSSSHLSVLASGDDSATVKFSRCRWIENKGQAAVLAYNEEKGEPVVDKIELSELQRPSGASTSVEFEFCHFATNDVAFGQVVVMGGEAKVDFSGFSGNEAKVGSVVMLAGAAGSNVEGVLSITNSCFLDNTAELPGTVFLDSDINLSVVENTENHGADNKITGTSDSSCSDIFLEQGGTCIEAGKCNGICMSFQRYTCVPQVLDEVIATNTTLPPPTASPPVDGKTLGLDDRFQTISYGKSGIFIRSLLISLFLLFSGIGGFVYLNKKIKKDKSPSYSTVSPRSLGQGDGEFVDKMKKGCASCWGSCLETLRIKKKQKPKYNCQHPQR